MIEPGEYIVEVGRSSADLPCSESFIIVGEWEAPLSTVYVELDKYCMNPGDTARMKVVATLEDTRRICLEEFRPVFTSTDETVAFVDDNGVITAKDSGTALITAAVTYGGKTVRRSAPVAVR